VAKIDRLKEQVRAHLDPDEEVLAVVLGLYETKIWGSASVRNGIFVATPKRLVFFARKVFGHDLEVFPYSNISSFESSKGLMGYAISFFASGNSAKMKWIQEGDIEEFSRIVREKIDRPARAESHEAERNDPIEAIRRLGELRDRGIVSAAEFEAKKAELLAKL